MIKKENRKWKLVKEIQIIRELEGKTERGRRKYE